MAKAERRLARAEFFDGARRTTRLLGVESGGNEFVVRTNDSSIGRKLFVKQARPEMSVLRQAMEITGPPRGTFVDVGANIGTVVITALALGFDRAVAVEPGPENARLLRANLALNGMQDRCRVVEAAATNAIGAVSLKLNKQGGGRNAIAPGGIEVAGVTLDSLAVEDPGMVWLDVQGHEGHALDGASALLAYRAPLVFEYHPAALRRRDGLELLEAAVRPTHPKLFDLRFRPDDPEDFEAVERRLGDSFTDVLALP